MLDVRRLTLLHELARRGTIAAVAEALAYTPSAVSQQLAALEREAGVPLLERSGRRVVLTPAGRMLAEHTDRVLAALERASAAVAATRDGLVGPVRIGAFATAIRTILPPALSALGRDHPDLEPMVDEVDPAVVADALRTGTLDVALVQDYDFVPTEPDPALDTEPLLDEPMYLASATGLPDTDDNPIRHCRAAPWIMDTPGTLCQTMAERACQAAGFTPHVRHHTGDFTAVLTLVATGQGVALVPQLAAGAPPEGVVFTPLSIRRRTQIAYRAGSGRNPAIAACVAALHTSAAERRST